MDPTVSVIVANHNGERHLNDALRSILAQSLVELEVLLVDDASTDRSVVIAEAIAANDPRLRILRLDSNIGPAAARNHAIAAARGTWIAIVDSDDYIHPDRLRRLVEMAESDRADIIADDQLVFHDDQRVRPRRLLDGALASRPSWIGAEQYVRANQLLARGTPLGYLKPLIRASALAERHVRYNESLRIAEDYDLILRLLTGGARFRLVPELLYFYRRHDASISHRLSPSAFAAMIVADARFRMWAGASATGPLRSALDARLTGIHVAEASEVVIANLKARNPLAAISALIRQPRAIPILARLATPRALLARALRKRQIAKCAVQPPSRPIIRVLSRQRLTRGSNGSSAYILGLCRALRENGFALHLIGPSPEVLGRVPLLRVAGEGDVFDRVVIRGTFRVGGLLFARDPGVYLRAAVAIMDRIARRIGITALSNLARPAPYAVGLPWTAEEFLFVAAEGRGEADIVLADYGFLTPGIPYALSPAATSVVVMHDLFSGRPEASASCGARGGVAVLTEAAEADLLARAELVVAIQPEDAAAARRMLPRGHRVLVAPMAIDAVVSPQPGEGGGLLFVGGGAAPNVDGMRWFLEKVWPRIRAQLPNVGLTVAGDVCGSLGSMTRRPGVTLLGRVKDLAPLYRKADLVISPLQFGSGLKIKLVEALAHGKPIVATSVTVQGFARMLEDTVAIADTPHEFAAQVVRLLTHPGERMDRAVAALDFARDRFSTEIAYSEIIDHLRARHGSAMEATSCAA
jgi:succinoglycan biosynthesis protein ExoO